MGRYLGGGGLGREGGWGAENLFGLITVVVTSGLLGYRVSDANRSLVS